MKSKESFASERANDRELTKGRSTVRDTGSDDQDKVQSVGSKDSNTRVQVLCSIAILPKRQLIYTYRIATVARYERRQARRQRRPRREAKQAALAAYTHRGRRAQAKETPSRQWGAVEAVERCPGARPLNTSSSPCTCFSSL